MTNTDSTDDLASALQNPANHLALDQVVRGEDFRSSQNSASILVSKYSHMLGDLKSLRQLCRDSIRQLNDLITETRSSFDPDHNIFDPARANIRSLPVFKFIATLADSLQARVGNTTTRVEAMKYYLANLNGVLDGSTPATAGNLSSAEESANLFLRTVQEEVMEGMLEFPKLIAGIYIVTKSEYRRLRKKFMGGAAGNQTDSDPDEDNFMAQLFGRRPAREDAKPGPAMALLDDNCMMTELLLNIVDAMPKAYQRTIPILKNGIATGRTKLIRQLDEGEVDEFGRLLVALARPVYIDYMEEPAQMLQAVMDILQSYHRLYKPIAASLLTVMDKSGLKMIGGGLPSLSNFQLADPVQIARPYSKINFLAIRPEAEDISPKNRMERDYETARTELLVHVRETVKVLVGMDRHSDDTEKYVALRVNEAIKLREEMDEVVKTHQQKILARNINDDNEFYVSKSGELGSISAERAPAPRISYDDVKGESFVKAKDHIEEVVSIASHANVMRISAPRGNVKSNLLFIGPYGSGKSEIARAIGADRRIIGFSVNVVDLLTAYMHESTKNVKRLYEAASKLRRDSRNTKAVAILMDEFDRLFSYGEGQHQAYDGPRMTGALQEMMDGVVEYEGVFLVAMTNVPSVIPDAVMRRFKFIDVVGQLNLAERSDLLKMFINRGLPIAESVTDADYERWATLLDGAPGDVLGKLADEVHFKFMREAVRESHGKIKSTESVLSRRLRHRDITDKDRVYLKKVLSQHRTIEAAEITTALEELMKQPQIQMQITAAKDCYKEAQNMLDGLSVPKSEVGFLAKVGTKNKLWKRD